MTSRLRVRTCDGGPTRVRPRVTSERLATAPTDPVPPRSLARGESLEKFGVIVFASQGSWQAAQVVLAFDTRLEAAAYAAEQALNNYLVAPLSFLAPSGMPRS